MLLLVLALIFLLGWPFEWPAIILVFLPIFYPVVQALNFDLIWFGALVAVTLQTAFLSPPVAMSAYYLKQVVKEWWLGTIYKGMFEFMWIQCACILLVLFVPSIALWLPTTLTEQATIERMAPSNAEDAATENAQGKDTLEEEYKERNAEGRKRDGDRKNRRPRSKGVCGIYAIGFIHFFNERRSNAIISFENSCACNGGIPVRRDERTGGRSSRRPRTARAQNAVDLAGGLTLQDNFKFFAERVDKLTGGTLKIETMAAGQVVPAFEVLDATNKKVLDGGARHHLLLGGQEQGRDALRRDAGRAVRHGPHGLPRLDVRRRRHGDVLGFLPEHDQAQRGRLPEHAVQPAGLRLVQAADQEPGRLQGHEMPPDRHRRRDLQAHGHEHGQHARRRDRGRGAARRDRLRRVGGRRRGPGWACRRSASTTTCRACTSRPSSAS